MTNPTTITASPGELVVDIDRVIDAPVAAVFRAYTDPELYSQWCGPRGYVMDITAFDVRDGGTWAFTHHTPGEGSFSFRGSFHSVDQDARIIQTFEYLGEPGHVHLESLTFEDLGGSTRIRIRSVFETLADRDGMVAQGMARGVTEGFEQLDELVGA